MVSVGPPETHKVPSITRNVLVHLPDVTEVDPVDATDMAILAEIQDVLKRHNALGRFGVNLLHQHFDMADDEIMVEYPHSDDPCRKDRSPFG
jgi:hypothetical protein